MSTYAEIFWTFAKIGTFTLGGGYAMVQMMEREVVDQKGWLSREEFMDTVVVSQSTPGLFAIDMSSHIGYKLKGVKGGVVGALATALPSVVIILLIAMFFQAFKGNPYVEKIFMGVRPCVVALILAPCFSMARKANLNARNWWIPLVCALLIVAFGVSPIWCIVLAGVGGYLWGRWEDEKNENDRI